MFHILKNKVAIVTGASRGIGAAIAERFAAEGAKVVITARTLQADGKLPGSLLETAARIRARGGECHCVQADLSDPVDRARIVPETIAHFGGVDILVNNAAWARFKATREQARRYTQMAFEINYFAPLELSQQAIDSMVGRGGGWILNPVEPHRTAPGSSALRAEKPLVCVPPAHVADAVRLDQSGAGAHLGRHGG